MIDTIELFKRTMLSSSLAVALLGCYSCSANQNGEATKNEESKATEQNKQAVMEMMSPNEQIAYSVQDLATRLNLTSEEVKVSGATPVSWRSGALGCPKPGMSYTDALVQGIWIVLRVDNVVYRYHAKTGGQPFYCPDDRAEPPVMGAGAD